ncbi:hypothetical protein A9K55_007721 [Cordyceps militaris]|uniref:Uncharacterized protein n=1 Tax=Cordyceps militaris TaxID=73501 RepID=A0A2H4SEQ9_CORMI|nr:hypothetical protein A9K55_007721 [Cordyceps militaris]
MACICSIVPIERLKPPRQLYNHSSYLPEATPAPRRTPRTGTTYLPTVIQYTSSALGLDARPIYFPVLTNSHSISLSWCYKSTRLPVSASTPCWLGTYLPTYSELELASIPPGLTSLALVFLAHGIPQEYPPRHAQSVIPTSSTAQHGLFSIFSSFKLSSRLDRPPHVASSNPPASTSNNLQRQQATFFLQQTAIRTRPPTYLPPPASYCLPPHPPHPVTTLAMSIFSHLRKSRQQAKEHNAKLAEQKKKDAQAVPYRHIPTHAASDAIASAPPAWREVNDRPRILEQNRRRSAMAAAGFSLSTPSTTTIPAIPRVTSSLSYVSYPSGEATPHVGMPRAYSSSSVHHAYPPGREIVYSMPDAALSQPSSYKGKDVYRNSFPAYDISGGSSSVVSKDPTPEGSSRASNSSHDELEIVMASSARPNTKPAPNLQVPQAQPVQQLQTYHQVQHTQQAKQLQSAQQAQIQTVTPTAQPAVPVMAAQQPQTPTPESPRPASVHSHRLHPSHRRTSSETSDRTAVPVSTKPTARDARPPPMSMRGFNYIPTTPTQQQPAAAAGQPELASAAHQSTPQHRLSAGYSGFAPRAPATPVIAPPASRNSSDVNLSSLATRSASLDPSGGPATPSSVGQRSYQSRMKEHTSPVQTPQPQPELEPIVSSNYTRHSRSEMPPPLAHDSLVNIFPEPIPDSYDTKSSRGKLGKVKKTRWSFAKSSPITA